GGPLPRVHRPGVQSSVSVDGWLLAVCAARMLMTSVFMTYAATLPVLRGEWEMSATAAGSIATGFQLGYAVSLLFFSSLGELVGGLRPLAARVGRGARLGRLSALVLRERRRPGRGRRRPVVGTPRDAQRSPPAVPGGAVRHRRPEEPARGPPHPRLHLPFLGAPRHVGLDTRVRRRGLRRLGLGLGPRRRARVVRQRGLPRDGARGVELDGPALRRARPPNRPRRSGRDARRVLARVWLAHRPSRRRDRRGGRRVWLQGPPP